MKKLALAAALAVSVAPLSAAADGAYIGFSVGHGLMHGQSAEDSKNVREGTRGAVGGLHIGWDKVFSGKWVLGAEGNVDLTSQKYVKTSFGVLGKAGIKIDNVTISGLVGWKNTSIENKKEDSLFQNKKKRANAMTVGGSIATMVTENIEVAGQYTHDFYSKLKDASELKDRTKLAQDIFRLKVSYKI